MKVKVKVIVLLTMILLTGCSTSDPEFEKQVKQDWEEAFQKAQLDPCSLEASSIRNATDQDPRFEAWAERHPLSACPQKSYGGGETDCGGYDENGNYIEITCNEVIGQIIGEG